MLPFHYLSFTKCPKLPQTRRLSPRRLSMIDTARKDMPPLRLMKDGARRMPTERKETNRKNRGDSQKENLRSNSDGNVRLIAASQEELCGIHARNASLIHSDSYLTRDALNSRSKVLITGILSPLGMHLALALYHRCGVRHIMGMDPMLPNTIGHRQEFAKRIEVLQRSLGDALYLPLLLPYVGLDPALSQSADLRLKQLRHSLSGTWEWNLLRLSGSFKPTHVIHLSGSYPNSFRDIAGERDGFLNADHPYVMPIQPGMVPENKTGDDSNTSYRLPPLLKIRQSGAGMEHILMSLSTADPMERPHFTYASSSDIYSWVGTRGRRISKKDNFHGATKMIDELLALSYSSLSETLSVGLRLPLVYGPWGLPGLNPEADLAELFLQKEQETQDDYPGSSWTAERIIADIDDRSGLIFVDGMLLSTFEKSEISALFHIHS